jgi:hypothetical protein
MADDLIVKVNEDVRDEGYRGVMYRLRAGSPIYDDNGTAYLHTFGGEKNEILVYDCATPDKLPSSDDFLGQGGPYVSASFARVGDKGGHFSGKVVYEPVYVQEDAVINAYGNNPQDDNPAEEEITFIECTSLNISYDVMGLVTVSYTVVSNKPGMKAFYVVQAGSVVYRGFITNASYNPLTGSSWYETHITLMAVTGYSQFDIQGSSTAAGGTAVTTTYPDWWYKYSSKKRS